MLRTDHATLPSNPEDAHLRPVPDVDALKSLLKSRRVDTSRWGKGNAKTVESLYAELASGEVELRDTPFRRVLTGVVQLIIRQGDNVLIEAEQVFYDGRRRARNIPPAEKMLPGETYLDATRRCLFEELQIDPPRVRPPVGCRITHMLRHAHVLTDHRGTQDARPICRLGGIVISAIA